MVAMAGCGSPEPAQQPDPLADHQSRFEALQAAIAGAADLLPAPGSVTASRCTTKPEPAPVSTQVWTSNTLFMLPEQLRDPRAPVSDSVLNVSYYPSYFRNALRAVVLGAQSKAPDEWAIARRRAALDSALAMPWLAVVRTTRVVMPEIRTVRDFHPGSFDAEVFLVDLRTRALACSFRVRHRETAIMMPFPLPRGSDELEVMRQRARPSLVASFNTVLGDSMRSVAGGDIQIK